MSKHADFGKDDCLLISIAPSLQIRVPRNHKIPKLSFMKIGMLHQKSFQPIVCVTYYTYYICAMNYVCIGGLTCDNPR